jgi:hypothetical protein
MSIYNPETNTYKIRDPKVPKSNNLKIYYPHKDAQKHNKMMSSIYPQEPNNRIYFYDPQKPYPDQSAWYSIDDKTQNKPQNISQYTTQKLYNPKTNSYKKIDPLEPLPQDIEIYYPRGDPQKPYIYDPKQPFTYNIYNDLPDKNAWYYIMGENKTKYYTNRNHDLRFIVGDEFIVGDKFINCNILDTLHYGDKGFILHQIDPFDGSQYSVRYNDNDIKEEEHVNLCKNDNAFKKIDNDYKVRYVSNNKMTLDQNKLVNYTKNKENFSITEDVINILSKYNIVLDTLYDNIRNIELEIKKPHVISNKIIENKRNNSYKLLEIKKELKKIYKQFPDNKKDDYKDLMKKLDIIIE